MEKWTKCWKCYWHDQCSSEKPCSDYTPICDEDDNEDDPEERERFMQEWEELLEEVEFF